MKRISSSFVIGLAAVFSVSSGMSAESEDFAERLQACAKTADEVARIACYEGLGQEALAEGQSEPAVTVPSPAESADTAATAGGAVAASVPATSAPTNVPVAGESPPEEYRIAVSSCRVTNAGETYFLLQNGETWKRTGGQHLRASDCNFAATLTKDFFGYKMAVDDGGGTVRVKRVK
ncbi:MAG: hypothetical protein L0Y45_08505 [Woeseiaceae bacterium]|nr:hypothetical protein [Woeseiaceae bacterium]